VIAVDTSAVIDLLRNRPTPLARNLELLIELGEALGFPAPVAQELLQGARDETEWRVLSRFIASQEILVPEIETYRRAAKIYYDCRRAALTVRSSVDCLVAQLALDRGGFLLADDRDYVAIATVRPIKIVKTVTLDEGTDER
jgi:predicted nucleic acid-binding protein